MIEGLYPAGLYDGQGQPMGGSNAWKTVLWALA